jgi:hypothetical protein
MLAVIAAIIFVIAYILRLSGAATDAAVAPGSLLFIGLALAALHLAGFGPAWSWPGRRHR